MDAAIVEGITSVKSAEEVDGCCTCYPRRRTILAVHLGIIINNPLVSIMAGITASSFAGAFVLLF
jgi:hypothetical protein